MRFELKNVEVRNFDVSGAGSDKSQGPVNQFVNHNLTKIGLSPMGARQALSGQPITSPADRTTLAALLAGLRA